MGRAWGVHGACMGRAWGGHGAGHGAGIQRASSGGASLDTVAIDTLLITADGGNAGRTPTLPPGPNRSSSSRRGCRLSQKPHPHPLPWGDGVVKVAASLSSPGIHRYGPRSMHKIEVASTSVACSDQVASSTHPPPQQPPPQPPPQQQQPQPQSHRATSYSHNHSHSLCSNPEPDSPRASEPEPMRTGGLVSRGEEAYGRGGNGVPC